MGSPVSASSRATASGMRWLRYTPPPAANKPRLTSGMPSIADSAATTTSQFKRSSKPPATAVAWAAPTIGTEISPPPKNRLNALMPSGLAWRRSGLARRERPQVHARAERAVTRAREHDGADVRVALGLVQSFAERAHERTVERVARVRSIQSEDEHGAALLAHQYGFVSHQQVSRERGLVTSAVDRGAGRGSFRRSDCA